VSDRQLAAFDFDGTLTHRDTLFGFLRSAFGDVALARGLAACAPAVARARLGRGPAGLHPRDVGKVHLLRSLARGREAATVAAQGEVYARSLPERYRPDVLARLRWHRREGHDVVLVSAGLVTYLDHLAADLDLETVIACELAADDRGVLTGELARPNVRGPEKEVRLRAWIADREPYGTIWAYGNSSGDRELLAMADHPTMVEKAPIPASP
jgi:phosphatidylglycerophosphatase C